MIKNKFPLALLLLILIAIVGGYFYIQKETTSLAYVDTFRLMENSKDVAVAGEQIKAMRQEKQSRVDTLASMLQAQLTEFEKNRKGMTSKEKDLSEELLNRKRNEYLRYSQSVDQEIQQEENKIMGEVVMNIQAIIKEYGKKKGYDFVIGNDQQGVVLYANKAKDITDEILPLINK